jgi:hypothetical protein
MEFVGVKDYEPEGARHLMTHLIPLVPAMRGYRTETSKDLLQVE